MAWLLLAIGALIGALRHELQGLLLGGLLGYLLGQVLDLTRRLRRLEAQFGQKSEVAVEEAEAAEPPATETPQAPAAETPQPELALDEVFRPAPAVVAPATTAPVAQRAADVEQGAESGPKLLAPLLGFFLDGNVVVRAGIVVLFFGVAFLLKYAADHSLLAIEWRLSGAALGAMAMITAGWRLRYRRQAYALLIQGGGIGLFYLTVYAAAKLYHLLPLGLAFGLMLALVALSALLALLQDSKALAAFGISGGFLAPVLTSTGGGSHVMLFSYYALLNGGILAIAWFRAWRELNLLGFLFTFVIGAAWGYQYYRPLHFASVEPFLILFFLFYVAIAVLFALRQPLKLRGYVDGSLVFGVPIVGFSLQYGLVRDSEYGLAFSALVLGFFYVGLATVLWRRRIARMRLLTESFLALGIAFATTAIPLALDGRWTAAAWAMEGAALLWVGVRQQRLLARLSGLLLQLGAGISFLLDVAPAGESWPLFNGFYLGTVLLALAGLFSAYQLQRQRERLRPFEAQLHYLALAWGLAWWLFGGLQESGRQLQPLESYAADLLLLALSAALLHHLYHRLDWRALRYPLLGLLPAGLLLALAAIERPAIAHPLVGWSWLSWSLLFALQYRLLHRMRRAYSLSLLRFGHMAAYWLLLFLLTWSLQWQVGQWLPQGGVWQWCTWALLPLLAMLLLLWCGVRLRWPLRRHLTTYLGTAQIPVAIYLLAWFLVAVTSAASPAPLPYLPLLNPLELQQLLILAALAVWLWQQRGRPSRILGEVSPPAAYLVLGASGFLLLNTVIAHSVHHWFEVPYRLEALHRSNLFQAVIAVVWSVTALIVTVTATRLGRRSLWIAGAGLLGLVVAKLFFVDLAGSGTIARIVSFIVAGVLMLLIGYLSPMPPKADEEAA